MAAASRCTLNRFEITIKVLQFYIFAILFAVLKYMACKLLTDKAIKKISNNYLCQVVLKQRGAPPINRLEVTIKVLLPYIFAMLFAVLKYMACKLLTDKFVKE